MRATRLSSPTPLPSVQLKKVVRKKSMQNPCWSWLSQDVIAELVVANQAMLRWQVKTCARPSVEARVVLDYSGDAASNEVESLH